MPDDRTILPRRTLLAGLAATGAAALLPRLSLIHI